jgi:ATP-binding cassette subfamily B multidrug efflux pump
MKEKQQISTLLKEQKSKLFVSIALSLIVIGGSLSQPKLIQKIISEGFTVLPGTQNVITNYESLNYYGILLISIGIISLLAGIFNAIIVPKIAQTFSTKLRSNLFDKIMGFSFQDIEKLSRGRLVTNLTNDVTQIQNLTTIALQSLIRVPIIFIGSFILAIITLPSLWWLLILYVIVVVVITGLLMPMASKSFGIIQRKIDETNTIVKENFEGSRVVRSLVTEQDEIDKYNNVTEELTHQTVKVGKIFSYMVPSYMFLGNVVMIGVFLLTGLNQNSTPDSIGSAVAFTSYLVQIMFSLIMGGFLMMSVNRARTSLQRIKEVLEQENQIKFAEDLDDYQQSGEFELQDVSFHYPGNDSQMVLTNISFKVNEGEQIGIIGQSGSGKSTLAQVITRLYDPTSGNVFIGGKNIKEIGKKNLADNISYVMQKPIIFSGTIAENIGFGNGAASQFEISQAANSAQAYEFIAGLPAQYNSKVEQRGDNLSGGQKQRLAIARGLIKKSKILILDDSTSALDARSENLVKTALSENYKGVTKLIIAQKVSSIINSDKIIVLKNGKIESMGTHQELLLKSFEYQKIVDSQKGGTDE